MLFAADEGDTALMTRGTQRLGGAAAGVTRADDDDVFVAAHALSWVNAL
jgi:hypothetical protein